MVTRYDKPADSNIQQTYTPIPFDQMMQAGQMMAQQYEQGMDTLQKVYDDTYNIKYIPGSKDEEYVKGQVIPAAKEIFTKYISQDMGNPIVRRQAMIDLNSRIDKNRIGKIQESWQGWAENQKWRQKLQAEGRYDKDFDTSDIGYNTEVSGVYSKLTPAALNLREKKETYMNNLRGSRYVDSKTGEIREYIDDSQIKAMANAGYEDYMKSGEGRQDILKYRKNTGDTKTSDELVAYKLLYDAGQEKKYNEVSGFVPEYMMKGNDDLYGLGSPEALATVDIPGSKLKASDFITKIKGKVQLQKDPQLAFLSRTGVGGGLEMVPTDEYHTELLDREEVKNIIKLLPKEYRDKYDVITSGYGRNKFRTDNPEGYDKVAKSLLTKLSDIYKNVDEHLKKGSYFRPFTNVKKREEATERILGSSDLKKFGSALAPNRKFYDQENNEVYTADEFIEKVVAPAIKEAEGTGMDATVHVTGLLLGDNPYSHPSLTNDPDFRKGHPIAIRGKNYIISGSPSNNTEILADKTYNAMKYLKNTELDEPEIPGLTEIYDGKNYTFKMNGKTLYSSPDFDNAYYTTLNYLRSN